jgi:hypothetical protein
MSYLADVKKQLKDIFDEAFGFAWEEMEKALKTSYKNGYEAGQKDAKEGSSPTEQPSATPRRQWRRNARPAATTFPTQEGGGS